VDSPTPRSLVIATDIDVLPVDRVVRREGDHLVVSCSGNPTHWWGNFLAYDDPPSPGDRERWEATFDAAFADVPATRHRAFTWDRTDGDEGAAAEFVARGYRLERTVGLAAAPAELRPHPRANRDVEIRALDPGGDEELWEGVVALLTVDHDPAEEPMERYVPFTRRRLGELRTLFAEGRGAWYVALDRTDRAVAGGCGVVATGGRGRFQIVQVASGHRRRGIASRLVVDAAADAARRHALAQLVISADADYHALAIYESLGFRPREQVFGLELPDRDAVSARARSAG
jgi:GNAT superfamily N-acetyltransferase